MSPTGKSLLADLARRDNGIDALQSVVPQVSRMSIASTLASLARHGYTTDRLTQGRAIYSLTDKGREYVAGLHRERTPGKLHVNSMMRNAVPSDFPRMVSARLGVAL